MHIVLDRRRIRKKPPRRTSILRRVAPKPAKSGGGDRESLRPARHFGPCRRGNDAKVTVTDQLKIEQIKVEDWRVDGGYLAQTI